ncbi:hypothetical protein DFS33DRAFT_1290770 [Desarmillaria ectypa]|nr:hypothetical protein DFS33DRAFT_1290770 [Desarmillaria ectypa]
MQFTIKLYCFLLLCTVAAAAPASTKGSEECKVNIFPYIISFDQFTNSFSGLCEKWRVRGRRALLNTIILTK